MTQLQCTRPKCVQQHSGATIADLTGSGVRLAFAGTNPSNNQNYVTTDIDANGFYEMAINTSTSSIAFDNGNGWSGTLAAKTGAWTIDVGTTSASLDFGTAISDNLNMRGFGFANFGNSMAFPSSSFNIQNIAVYDSAVLSAVPEPSSFAMLSLLGLGFIRRKQA